MCPNIFFYNDYSLNVLANQYACACDKLDQTEANNKNDFGRNHCNPKTLLKSFLIMDILKSN